MSDHPPAFRLDAHVAGDLDPRVTAHLASCDVCTAYVAKTTAGAADFAASEGKKAADFVRALEDVKPRRNYARIGAIAAPILMAAALLLLVRGRDTRPLDSVAAGSATRFKGKMQIAVIRDRSGDQSRILGEVRVRPGDRLRVELSLDEARPIEVGFLGRDGTWIPLLAPALIEAGTHFSERAARFDDVPTEGVIVAGDPDQVKRARETRSFDDVDVVPVIKEP